EHTHVLAKAWPDELAVGIGLEPVHAIDARHCRAHFLEPLTQLEPMIEVRAHVVAAKWQHGEGIAAHYSLLARRRSRRFRTHGGSHVDAFNPIASLGDQWHGVRAPTAKNEGVNWHTRRVIPLGVDDRVLIGSHGKA